MRKAFRLTRDRSSTKKLKQKIYWLIERFKSLDQIERNKAGLELIRIGKPAIPWLISSLKDKNPWVRGSAARILGIIGGKDVVAPLIEAMDDANDSIRKIAMTSLAYIGKPAVPLLIKALKSKDVDRQLNAEDVLALIGKHAIPNLVKALKDKKIQYDVANILGRIGEPAVPSLIAALKDKNLREYAIVALGKTGDPKAIAALISQLKAKDTDLKLRAIEGLENIAWKNPSHAGVLKAQHLLIRFLKGKDIELRYAAAVALSEIGTKSALPALRKVQRSDPIDSIREAARKAMNTILKRGIIRKREPKEIETFVNRRRGRLA
jgi:HEAT repeat protein